MSQFESYQIGDEDPSGILQRLEEFLVPGKIVVFNVSNSPDVVKSEEVLTQFGIAKTYGYKFEKKEPGQEVGFPVGSLLKVACTTRDGQHFTVSRRECPRADIRHADGFELLQPIPELINYGNRDIEILIEITSKANEGKNYILSNINIYQAEMKAILGIQQMTDMQSQPLEIGQEILFEGEVVSSEESGNMIIKVGDVNINCNCGKFRIDLGEDYLQTTTLMVGDKIQVSGIVSNLSQGEVEIQAGNYGSIELREPGVSRKKEINEITDAFDSQLLKARAVGVTEEERKKILTTFIMGIFDYERWEVKISEKQFNTFSQIIKFYYNNKDLSNEQKPIIFFLVKESKFLDDVSYLLELIKGMGEEVIFSSKAKFKQDIINFYLEDANLEKIKNTDYPLFLLDNIFTPEEIGEIMKELVETKKQVYNETQGSLNRKKISVFESILESVNMADTESALSIFEFLLQDIINGNYRKRISNENPENEEIHGKYDEGPDNFFEYEISQSMKDFLWKLKESGRENVLEDLIKTGGLIDQVRNTLDSDDAYRYPYGGGIPSRNYVELLQVGRDFLNYEQ